MFTVVRLHPLCLHHTAKSVPERDRVQLDPFHQEHRSGWLRRHEAPCATGRPGGRGAYCSLLEKLVLFTSSSVTIG